MFLTQSYVNFDHVKQRHSIITSKTIVLKLTPKLYLNFGEQLYPLCGETSDVELDPIEGDEDSGLEYQWTYLGSLHES